MSIIKFMLSWVENENNFITSGPGQIYVVTKVPTEYNRVMYLDNLGRMPVL